MQYIKTPPKTYLLVCFFLFLGVILIAQDNTKIDSLAALVANPNSLSGEEKIKIYRQLAKLNRRINPEQQLKYANKMLKEAEDLGDQKSQGIAISEIASHYQKADNYDEAYSFYVKSLDFFVKERNIGNAYSRISYVEQSRGNYVESISWLIKSNAIFEKIDFTGGRIANYIHLGILLSTTGDYEEAITYYKKAEALIGEKDIRSKSSLYTNFAVTYNFLNDLDKSKEYLDKSIVIKEKLNDINGLANAYVNLAGIARRKGQTDLNILYIKKAISAYQKMNNKKGEALSYNALGETYRSIGDLEKAEEYLLKSNKLTLETKNHQSLLNNNEALYKLYADQKKWNKAYTYLLEYDNLKDTITNVEKLKISKELQVKYESERIITEKELAESNSALAEQKANNSKNLSIAISAIGALILAIVLFIFYRFRSKKKEEVLSMQLQETEKRLKLEQQTRISELKALQSQMNPHFVFNILNSIQDLILLQDIRSSNKYLGKFSDLFRRILSSSNSGVITISEEIKTLKLYVELEQLRFGDELHVQFKNDVDDHVSEEFLLPVMFIQPYLENALKHGLLHKTGRKELIVHFYLEDNSLVCAIDDNGVGRKKALELQFNGDKKHLGFSTQANLERIDLLNTGRTNKITINVVDKHENSIPSGTTVLLYFPFEESENSSHT